MDTTYPELVTLAGLLADIEPEVRADSDGGWLSIPVGYLEAIEVEYSGGSVDTMFVYRRKWAPDHGLESEIDLGLCAPGEETATFIRQQLAQRAAQDAELEALLGPGE